MDSPRYLIDTHLLYWGMTGSPKLGADSAKRMQDAEIVVSAASLWETILSKAKTRKAIMSTSIQISLDEVQAKLPEIVHGLGEGDEVVIVEGKRPVARLLGSIPTKRGSRTPGSARGKLTVLADDDEHLKDFGDYMP